MNPNCQVFFDLVSLLNGSADTIHPGRLGRARRSCLGHEWMRKQATSIVVITSTGDTPVSSNLRNPGQKEAGLVSRLWWTDSSMVAVSVEGMV